MWEQIYEEFWDKLEHFCAKLCHDESRAEDLTQEVFLKALQNRSLIDSFTPRQCKAWLFATARNLYCDQVRRLARERKLMEKLLPAGEEEQPDETASAAVGLTDLDGLMELLDPLDAYESCTLDAVVALTNRRAQNLLARKGVQLDAALTINSEEELEVNVVNGKVVMDGETVPGKKRVLLVNGKLFLKPEATAALDHYESIVVNGKIYYPASMAALALAKCSVNGMTCVYPDDAVVLNGTVKLDRSFLLRAQSRLYWAERVFVAADPKLDAAALAATGAHFAGPKAILTESNAAVLAPLFSDDTQLIILPDGTTVLDDDLELNTAAFRRCGTRLYVMGDVTVAEGMGEQLKQMEYFHADGDVILPAALEEIFFAIPELEYQELKLLEGHAIVGAPMLRLGREMLELYPEGITCVGCAAVRLDEDLEPDVIAKKLHFDGCAMIRCTARQENAVHAVSRDVARVQVGDLAGKKENDTVKIDGVRVCL